MSSKKVLDVTTGSRLGLAAACEECSGEEESLCVFLLLFPAESAKQAINRSNPNGIRSCGHIKKHILQLGTNPRNRAHPLVSPTSQRLLEDAREFHQKGNWLQLNIVMPSYAASGISAKPSLVYFSSPWQRREDHLPRTRSYSNPSTPSRPSRP